MIELPRSAAARGGDWPAAAAAEAKGGDASLPDGADEDPPAPAASGAGDDATQFLC